mmetsp:Transcript_28812/g.43508  ORF Transcript_28812/g.43508 Transcript_28812/m.43508 type:complete len:215 (+) Transcript_28812:112-756(+)|eukprot:CAMPEP_0178897692 /NCGR_PEP_ID=MMETSP0786-20121207/1897_1 /TAXON_ID=186022 /ORGANISM="Thalassionema frauenfeldii, Strain CCMP 1798" /LENGTH=214 /DNA_ID=CAMNT_0020568289 /DNA_START=59 /DNA_END=703 /DNA_ORIENTATION=+
MPTDMCTRRLQREFITLQRDPIKNPKITAKPLENNILEWHYVIEGGDDTPYAGGYYHGKLIFPKEYPLKPPGVMMCTPSGRFVTNRRLCLSMSDFHPETWNPMWSVGTVLLGLCSFMVDNAPTSGSIESSLAGKRRLAKQSLDFNVRDPVFCQTFPEYVDLQQERRRLKTTISPSTPSTVSSDAVVVDDINSILAVAAGFVAVISIVLAMLRFL